MIEETSLYSLLARTTKVGRYYKPVPYCALSENASDRNEYRNANALSNEIMKSKVLSANKQYRAHNPNCDCLLCMTLRAYQKIEAWQS